MNQVHFSANFYYLRSRMQVLEEVLALDINAQFFNVQIMEEIRNLDRVLDQHKNLLEERKLLKNYNELTYQLLRIQQVFFKMLINFMHSKQDFTASLIKSHLEEWKQLIRKHGEHSNHLSQYLQQNLEKGEREQDSMVSDEEFTMLFSPEEEFQAFSEKQTK